MDATTQVIIATLSGFLVAFLAEPVKELIRHRNRLYSLKVALYKEILSNYECLTTVSTDELYAASSLSVAVSPIVRNECYEYAIEREISLFYELDEAVVINGLQKEGFDTVLDAYNLYRELLAKKLPKEEFSIESKQIVKWCMIGASVYCTKFRGGVRAGKYDKKLIKKLDKELYPKITGLDGSPIR
jgi:hypothetical protein